MCHGFLSEEVGYRSGRCGHLATSLRALPARLSTLLTMLHRVLCALVCASGANAGAQGADSLGVLTAAGYRRGGELANGRAIHIQGDAARHHLDVLLLQTRRGAVIAGHRAGIASVDTGLMSLVRHGSFSG